MVTASAVVPVPGLAQRGDAVYVEDRLNQLQQSLTMLTGQLEQLQNRNQQLQQQMEKMQADYEYRLEQMEKGGGGRPGGLSHSGAAFSLRALRSLPRREKAGSGSAHRSPGCGPIT